MIPVLAGQIPDFDLPQIVSILEYARMSGCLRVLTPNDRGILHFHDGNLTTAETGELRGELAAMAILSWPEGNFSFLKGVSSGRPAEISRSNQSLLLEAMRLLDESLRTNPVFTATRKGRESMPAGPGRRVLSAVSSRAMSLSQIADATGLSRLEVYYHFEHLEAEGLAKRVEPGAETLPVAADDRLRILIVDDSNLMQKALTRLYETDPGITVIGTASNGQEGLEALARLKPDIVSLDLYMPVMDGVATLKHIMLSQPTPTVVVTSANPESLDLTFESILRFGAIDFITKPSKSRGDIEGQTRSILTRLRKAAKVNLRGLRMVQPPPSVPGTRASRGRCQGAVIAAAGTGACLSYMQVLTSLPADLPFAVIGSLPFPDDFLRAFVAYLGKSATFSVEAAEDGKPLESGVCYLVGSEQTVRIVPSEAGPCLTVVPKTTFLSVSTLMAGAARVFGHRSVGLVLSGSGDDVIDGLAAIRAAGGVTLAQLPASCVDPEQPELAIESGLVDRTVLPNHISGSLSQLLMSRLMKGTSETPNLEEMVKTCPEESASPYR
ncbi:MAG: response regulator [Thermoanaerobaculia bacterium]|nr:response regulator [Thermoanaerobaculia bacterium]